MIKISIVMTVYNGQKHLAEQLDSFLNQSYLPHEIIISDDCSTDNTLQLLEKYKNNIKINIKIYKNTKNIGFTKNFEKAISKSSGDIVFLSDQDDIWYHNKIETIIKKFNTNQKINLIIHDAHLVNTNLKKTGLTALSQVNSGFSNDDVFITGALTAFKRDILKFFLPFPKKLLGHDGYMHFIARSLGTRMVINNKLQIIRRHENNTSNWVASSLKKINKFDVFKNQFFSKRSKDYNDRLVQVNKAIHLINVLRNKKHYFSNDLLANSLINLKNEKKALKKRNLLQGQNFFKKKIIIFDLLFNNQYTYFNGMRSFVRDLLR